jgi:hypothetical protein
MIRYAFKTGMPFVDWTKELSQRKRIDSTELSRLSQLASDWRTCPVGQQSIEIVRIQNTPDDETLTRYGGRFSLLLAKMYFAKKYTTYTRYRLLAKRLIARIEKRSDFLIRKSRKNKI